jgi:hypothetical protein
MNERTIEEGRRRVEAQAREIATRLGLTEEEWHSCGWSSKGPMHALVLEDGERVTIQVSHDELANLTGSGSSGVRAEIEGRLEDALRKIASPLAKTGF